MPKRHRPGQSATSVLTHIEDIVVATSGEDAFELVFAVAAARVTSATRARGERRPVTRAAIATIAKRYPELAIKVPAATNETLVARVDTLLGSLDGDPNGSFETIDAIFESLVPRVAKGDKGQFFTPRHVVDFVVRALAPRPREILVDPACGSGAFLSHARALASVRTHGCDVDPRAVRVARLAAVAQGRDPAAITRGDGLRDALPTASIVATNPPFAGRADPEGFEAKTLVKTPERDVLFLERAVRLLRPGGRLGIVLPYNKASGSAFGALRRWLAQETRILAIVGLPRETFLPHTSQRTFVLFAQKRLRPRMLAGAPADGAERTMFVVSERAGKDTSGEPIFRGGAKRELDHDLDDVLTELTPFLAKEMRSA